MASIFDPPAGTRTFNASDWLAAIDVQLALPPQPADSEPTAEAFDDPLATWDTQPAATHRRTIRNLPWAIVATCAVMSAMMIYLLATINAFGEPFSLVWIALLDPPLWLLWAGLAACVLELVIWLILAWRFE
jgi:hypothetical protein